MRSITRTLGIPGLVLVVAATAVVTTLAVVPATLARRPLLAAPSSVVSVNLPEVLEKLDQREHAELELKGIAEGMQAEDDQRQAEVKELRSRLADIPESDVEQRQQLNEDIALKLLEFEAWRRFASEQLDIEKSIMLRDLNRAIERAVGDLAQTNGYDYVLLDDTGRELTVNSDAQVSREVQVKQQMLSRRMLYVNPVADVTDQLIERMNNAFNAGG